MNLFHILKKSCKNVYCVYGFSKALNSLNFHEAIQPNNGNSSLL